MENTKRNLLIQQKIAETERKLKELQYEVENSDQKEVTNEAKSALDELSKLNNEIKELHDKMAKIKVTDELQYSEAEKNIYNSIDSFNTAFNKAGSLFSPRLNRKTEKSYKNPLRHENV
jgi:hypothetical protein